MKRKNACHLRFEPLEARQLLAPVINEFLTRNDGGLRDGYGRSSDWIEIYNPGEAAIDLGGYRLTDDASDASKWTFPNRMLDANEFLVVFASGKTNDEFVDPAGSLHTNFTLRRGGEYLALIDSTGAVMSEFGTSETTYPEQLANVSFGGAQSATLVSPSSETHYHIPGSDSLGTRWTEAGFDAAANGFAVGTASVGYETRPQNRTNFVGQFETELPDSTHAVYLRTEFELGAATLVNDLRLRMRYDNGFAVYLNGQKVLAENAPETLGWFSQAVEGSRRDGDALKPEEFDLGEHTGLLVDGTNVLAVHALNNTTDNSDLLFTMELSAGASDPDDAFGIPNKIGYMTTPSPGAANASSAEVFSGFVQDTKFSLQRGFYDAPAQLEITTETPDAEIRYTTDGSEPTAENGTAYTGPVTIDALTVVRAAAFKTDFIPTNVDTQSYFYLNDVLTQTRPDDYETLPQGADYDVDPDIALSEQYRDRMLAGLRDIPTMSVALHRDDFVGGNGIYSNPTAKGFDWERPASAELIDGSGSTMFQIDAGFRVQGGASRNPDRSPKHAFSLRFRSEYGAGRLNYPLFANSQVESFDAISLRAGYNNSWIHSDAGQRGRSQQIRDQWVRDSLLDMGNPSAGHGFPVHMYVNGLYWGVFHLTERPDAAHYVEYNEVGDTDTLDARNGAQYISGNGDAYNEMRQFAQSGDWESLQQVLDVDNYIDFQIINRYGGNDDLKTDGNWRAAGGGPDGLPWQLYSWDAERVLESPTSRSRPLDPLGIRNDLEDQLEYKVRFADRVQKHFFNGGALTPEEAAERYSERARELDLAIIAESARWGDHRRANDPYDRDDDWITEQQRVLNDYFPVRTDNVLEQYRDAGLFPSIDAPVLNQHGGVVAATFDVQLSADRGIVYYTLDGSDPRLTGGEVATHAVTFSDAFRLASDSIVKARVLADGEWSALTEASFRIASELPIRITELNYNPHIANSVPGIGEAEVDNDRFEFVEVTNVGTESIDLQGLRLVRDDVNGVSQGIEFEFASQSLAAGSRIVVPRDVEAFRSRYGDQVALARGTDGDGETSSEFVGRLSNNGERITLVDGSGQVIQQFDYRAFGAWPSRANGGGSSLEIRDADGNPNDPAMWQASLGFGGSPGAPSDFAAPQVRINEILPHARPTEIDQLELRNASNAEINIGGWYISDTADNYFKTQISGGATIPGGGFAVLSEAELGFSLNSANGGEVFLIQTNANGRPVRFVHQVSFGTTPSGVSIGPWPDADGELVSLREVTLGAANSARRTPEVIISEIYHHPLDPDGDGGTRPDNLEFVEIHNPGSQTIDLTGWQLAGVVEYEFPEETLIEAGQSVTIVGFRTSRVGSVTVFRFTTGMSPQRCLVRRLR